MKLHLPTTLLILIIGMIRASCDSPSKTSEKETAKSTEPSKDAESQFRLGLQYREGMEVAQSDTEAAKYFRRAAELGHVGAQYILGRCYEEGKGVAKDDAEAAKWFLKAAEKGDIFCQYLAACRI